MPMEKLLEKYLLYLNLVLHSHACSTHLAHVNMTTPRMKPNNIPTSPVPARAMGPTHHA